MGEVSNSYSEFVVEVEVEGEGEKGWEVVVDKGREVVVMATVGIGEVCLIIGGGGRERDQLNDGAGGVELANGFLKGYGGHRNVLVK